MPQGGDTMSNLLLEDLQRLTPSQGVLLHRLADLGYLTRDQVDELVNRLAADRMIVCLRFWDR